MPLSSTFVKRYDQFKLTKVGMIAQANHMLSCFRIWYLLEVLDVLSDALLQNFIYYGVFFPGLQFDFVVEFPRSSTLLDEELVKPEEIKQKKGNKKNKSKKDNELHATLN